MLSVFNGEMIGACLHVGCPLVIESLSSGCMDTKPARTEFGDWGSRIRVGGWLSIFVRFRVEDLGLRAKGHHSTNPVVEAKLRCPLVWGCEI